MPQLKLPARLTAKQRKAFELFQATGLELTQEMVTLILSADASAVKKKSAEVEREVELFLRSLDNPNHIVVRVCPECHREFGTDYASVKFCSNDCRETALLRVGIVFDHRKSDSQRYDNKVPPAIIPPETFSKLVSLLQHLTSGPTDTSFKTSARPAPTAPTVQHTTDPSAKHDSSNSEPPDPLFFVL